LHPLIRETDVRWGQPAAVDAIPEVHLSSYT
jgi:hypothetical protein